MTRQGKTISRRELLKLISLGSVGAYLAACAPSAVPGASEAGEAPAASEAKEMPAQPAQEKKVISISHITGGSVAGSEEGQRMKMLRENFPDIEFDNQWVSYAAYRDKIPLMIASGDLADLQFCNAFNDIPLMMENDSIIETGPLLEKHGQHILAATPEEAWLSTIYDGKQVAVTHNIYDLNVWCSFYRKDWLDKLGLGVPETLDEYREALIAFSHGDPDGNGQDDTWGRLLYTTIRFDDDIFHAFDVAVGHHLNGFWRQRGDTLELDWVQPEMKEALAWMRDVWADGGFHPDAISIPLGQRMSAFVAGTAGNAYGSWKALDTHTATVRTIHPEAEVVAGPAPEGPGGRGFTGEGWPWCYVISRNAQWPEDCVRVIDWFYTPEIAAQVVCSGHLGVTNKGLNEKGWCEEFSLEEKIAMGEEWTNKLNEVQDIGDGGLWLTLGTVQSLFDTFPPVMKAHFEAMVKTLYSENALQAQEYAQEYIKLTAKTRPVEADKENWPGLQTRFGEFISQAVAGTIDLDQGWGEWLDYFEQNGGPEITEQVNLL